jgi:hypothetical protein
VPNSLVELTRFIREEVPSGITRQQLLTTKPWLDLAREGAESVEVAEGAWVNMRVWQMQTLAQTIRASTALYGKCAALSLCHRHTKEEVCPCIDLLWCC